MSADTAPRDPAALRPSLHFAKDTLKDPRRHVSGEIIRACITDGTVEPHSGALRYRATVGGVTYRTVVDAEKGEVVTAYPTAINTEAARESGRWSSKDIADIRGFLADG